MHYITGTNFTVSPNPTRAGVRDRRFKPGNSYSLVYISKKQDKMLYTFIGIDRVKFDIEFNTCRDADIFISRIRNETIPNYETPASIADTVED